MPNRHQAITWTNDVPIQWHIYASLGLNICVDPLHLPSCSLKMCICILYNFFHKHHNTISDIPMNQPWVYANRLTHFPLVPHICVSEMGRHWFRYWLVAYSAPSHYLKQCWVISSVKFLSKYKTFHSWKCIWKYRLRNGSHFVQWEMS